LLYLPAGDESKKVCINMPKLVYSSQQVEPFVVINTHLYPQVEEVRVDMARMKVESKPVELLTSVGSCVAICLYDSIHRCGGLAHIMLPHSSLGPKEPIPSKFADTAVPAMVKEIREIIGAETHLSAKIAGGANMFSNTCANGLDIGTKNVRAVKATLSHHRIRLIGEDVGGLHGRRVTFNITSGNTLVRLHSGEIKKL
jgi:chemotaxis protein CheD